MRSAKRVGLVLLGVLIGWLASGSLWAEAQQVPTGRIVIAIPVAASGGLVASFLQDSKTRACWLTIRSDMGTALAPAPRESCEK